MQSKKTSEIEVFQKLAMFFSNSVQIMSCFGRPINVQSNGGVNASSVLLVSQQDLSEFHLHLVNVHLLAFNVCRDIK